MNSQTGKTTQAAAGSFTIEGNVIKGAEVVQDYHGTAAELILRHMAGHRRSVGQIDAETGEQTTYAEMRERSASCAIWMQDQGIGVGDVVAICAPNRMDSYIPFVASFLVGAVCNPWHHELTLDLACHFMSLSKPKLAFVCEEAIFILQLAACLENVPTAFVVFGQYLEVPRLDELLLRQTMADVLNFRPKFTADPGTTTSMIMFSSGTTGLPKAVALSYASLLRNLTDLTLPKCVFLAHSPLYWISGSLFMLQCLISGAVRIVQTSTEPEDICRAVDRFQVNVLFLSPSLVARFGKLRIFEKHETESLSTILTGGSKLSAKVIARLLETIPHASFVQGWGMTELSGVVTVQSKRCKFPDSVGFVKAGYQLKFVDVDTGELLGPGKPGELMVKSGATMMIGYYGNPSATRQTIDEEGWLHTGDVAYYTEEGEIMIVDRIKEVMKFRGHQVSPSELEEVLLRHPAVMEVAVVPVPHETDIERPMAFVKKVPGAQVSEQELVDMTSKLGEFKKLWGGVEFLDKLPYTATGKVGRKDLKEMAKNLNNRSGVGTGD